MHTEKNTSESLFPPEKFKALNKEIISKSKVEEFIPLTLLNDSSGVIEYVDNDRKEYKEFNKETGIYEIKTKPFTKFVQTGEYRVSISVTQQQIQDLNKQWGIDVILMINNAQIHESSQALVKQYFSLLTKLANKNKPEYTLWDKILLFMYKIIKKEYVKKVKIKNSKDLVNKIISESNKILSRTKKGPANFCIVGGHAATILQDNESFNISPATNSLCYESSIYQIGTLSNMKVYINPMLPWNDRSVILGRKVNKIESGAHIAFYENGTSVSLIAEDLNAPRSILSTRYAIFEKGFHPEYNYSKFTYKD